MYSPLDQTRVEFDEDKIDRIVNDVRDKAHLNARRATQSKYE
jgi:tetrahydromethanopterin S-methyltransferase subunit F